MQHIKNTEVEASCGSANVFVLLKPLFTGKNGRERRLPGVRRLSGVYESCPEHRKGRSYGFVHRRGGSHPHRPHSLRHHPPPLRQEEGPGGDLPGAAVRRFHGGREAGRHHRAADAGGGLVSLPPAHHRVAVPR